MTLQLRGISAGYGGSTVLRDVTLAVASPGVTALIGPNGAGKSTLLRVAAGMLKPQHGSVILDDEDCAGRSPGDMARAGLCFIPEGRAIFPTLSVRENLRVFSRLSRSTDGTERALEAFPELAPHLSQIAGTMSGGQQQMLALSRAYIARPKVVLFDEISMGLAPIIVGRIFDFVRRIADDGVSVLLVEQFVGAALRLADDVYTLERGRATWHGSAATVSTHDLAAPYLGTEPGPSPGPLQTSTTHTGAFS